MKKKLFKTVAVCLLGAIVMLTLTSCGGGTKTVSEYLKSKDRVIAYYCRYSDDGLGKDTPVYDAFVFEGDKLTRYCSPPLNLEWVALSSDDEVVEFCDSHVDESDITVYDSYRLVCYTDSTGNNVSSEGIQVGDGKGGYEYVGDTDLFYVGDTYEVYDAEFTELVLPDTFLASPSIALKDAPNIVLDGVDSDDVVVDP